MRRGFAPLRVVFALLGIALLGRCASVPPTVLRDTFPFDPREGLPGPFDEAVVRGWAALLAADASAAQREFRAAAAHPDSRRAADIGTIEALVLERKSAEALPLCATALEEAGPTVALLAACGEAHARTDDPAGGAQLYERAAALAPGRAGLAARAASLREKAAETLLEAALASAQAGRRDEAQRQLDQGLLMAARTAPVMAAAGDVECALGERARALADYREALELGGSDPVLEERAAEIALELGDTATAVSLYEELAARDPRFAEKAAEARLAFRISNWPDAERQAARARRLTRASAVLLVWWMFPEIPQTRIVPAGVVATDVLERRDGRVLMRAISLGLLDVDADTHRARPDAPLTRVAAARMMLLLASRLGTPGRLPTCFEGAPGPGKAGQEAIRVAARCKLLSESGGSVVGGAEFTRGLDRLRTLFPAGEAKN